MIVDLQPESTKVQAIIEKTARFISTQGPQMEILIKAKQANNPLFDFLNQSGRLNPFYKHTLQAMKDGNYPADDQKIENTQTLPNSETTGSMYQSYYSSNTPVVSSIYSIFIHPSNLNLHYRIQIHLFRCLCLRLNINHRLTVLTLS